MPYERQNENFNVGSCLNFLEGSYLDCFVLKVMNNLPWVLTWSKLFAQKSELPLWFMIYC